MDEWVIKFMIGLIYNGWKNFFQQVLLGKGKVKWPRIEPSVLTDSLAVLSLIYQSGRFMLFLSTSWYIISFLVLSDRLAKYTLATVCYVHDAWC